MLGPKAIKRFVNAGSRLRPFRSFWILRKYFQPSGKEVIGEAFGGRAAPRLGDTGPALSRFLVRATKPIPGAVGS
jgi:hypothetical protein